MSADAWWVCKICNPNRSNNKKYLHPEYETIETVRVDYEVFMSNEGEFCFSGTASCGLCGRNWKINIRQKAEEKG